tara:strand:- start:960 stop:1703 length:744 start_codon:yes stop_codon:yes gene_type:complete
MSINTDLCNPSKTYWDQLHWHPSSEQLAQFSKLQVLLKYWNNQVNLTRLIDGTDYWIAQIFDSLWPLKNELENPSKALSFVDVGTGCGFPGLAIAIALPNVKITLIDSLSRKTKILQTISNELGLSSRTRICNERVEITAHKPGFREGFDFALARAVADAPIVAEYLIPLLKKEGEGLIYRGKWNKEKQVELNTALNTLKAKIKIIERMELPQKKGERHVIRIVPEQPCSSKYPRSVGIPLKKPLCN